MVFAGIDHVPVLKAADVDIILYAPDIVAGERIFTSLKIRGF